MTTIKRRMAIRTIKNPKEQTALRRGVTGNFQDVTIISWPVKISKKKRVTVTQQGKCIIYILNTSHKLYRNIKEVKVIIITIIFYNIFHFITFLTIVKNLHIFCVQMNLIGISISML